MGLIPTQDEPEGMSKLGIDHQHDGRRGIELGADPEFLKASGEIEFRGQDREEIYGWLGGLLCRHEYWVRKKDEKGLLRQYVFWETLWA